MRKLVTITLLLSSQYILPALADERRGPPQRAFDACASLNVDDACEVETRRGNTIAGQCKVPRRGRHNDEAQDSTTLLCVPEHRRQRHSDRDKRTESAESEII